MPRGRGKSHKGQSRRFTDSETLAADNARLERKSNEKGDAGESDTESGEEEDRRKGVNHLIETQNPNRAPGASLSKKVDQLDLADESEDKAAKPELSRREREEKERVAAAAAEAKLHAEGKTEQAQADLARLAIIRRERAEAAEKAKAEKEAKDKTLEDAAAARRAKLAEENSAKPGVKRRGGKGKK